jgi:glycosyltransferase involved in cell wall biosynthesis
VKIVYVITRADSVGGATIHVRDLARAVLDRGHQATVVVGGRGVVTDLLAAAGVPFRSVEFLQRAIHPLRDLRAISELASVLRDLHPDLVSTHTAKAGWVGRAACARLGLPVIYTPHGLSVGNRISAPLGLLFTLAERVASRWTRAMICVCDYEKRLALSKRVASLDQLYVVHNGVGDVPETLRAVPARTPARLCSVARLASPKDHATLLRALATLRSQEWELDLVGDGPCEPLIRRLADELGLSSRVHFLGYQSDPAPILARAQIFVLSSRSEAFPRSVLEAMRAGLAIVASSVGGLEEAITHDVSGLLVPPGHPPALAAALGGLFDDPSRRERLGAAARAAYQGRFRLEHMVEATLGVYATVLKGT